jgi:hypothetical protein
MSFREPTPEIVQKIEEITGYSNRRRSEYLQIAEQLDKLYHDIEAGLFGDAAKTGEFYNHINSVKAANPKPDNLDTLKSELDTLFAENIEPDPE